MNENPYHPPSGEMSSADSPTVYYRSVVRAATLREIRNLTSSPLGLLNGILMKLGFPEPLNMAQSIRPLDPIELSQVSSAARESLNCSAKDLEALGYTRLQSARLETLGDAETVRSLYRHSGHDRLAVCIYSRCLSNENSTISLISMIKNSPMVETYSGPFSIDDGTPSETERYEGQSTEWLHDRHSQRLLEMAEQRGADFSVQLLGDDSAVIRRMDEIEQAATCHLVARGILKPLTPVQERRLRAATAAMD